jgi:hypothetical protein
MLYLSHAAYIGVSYWAARSCVAPQPAAMMVVVRLKSPPSET